jgi:hypothetical protein
VGGLCSWRLKTAIRGLRLAVGERVVELGQNRSLPHRDPSSSPARVTTENQ